MNKAAYNFGTMMAKLADRPMGAGPVQARGLLGKTPGAMRQTTMQAQNGVFGAGPASTGASGPAYQNAMATNAPKFQAARAAALAPKPAPAAPATPPVGAQAAGGATGGQTRYQPGVGMVPAEQFSEPGQTRYGGPGQGMVQAGQQQAPPTANRYDKITKRMMPASEYSQMYGNASPPINATAGVGGKPAGSMGKQSLWHHWEKRAGGMMFEKLLDKQQPGGKTESSLKLPGTTGSKGCCGSKGPADSEPDFDRQAAITQKIRANAKKRKPRPAAADVALS